MQASGGHVPFQTLALFPGPAQLSVPCGTEKRGGPGMFPHVSILRNRQMAKQKREVLHVVQPTTHSMLGVYGSHSPLARYVW